MEDRQLDLFPPAGGRSNVAGHCPIAPRTKQPRLTTADGLVPDDTGLLARPIKRHSIEKAFKIGRFADTVATAIHGKLPVYWVELFCGPGRLQVVETGEFVDGSPLQALAVRPRFTGYFFADLSAECVTTLRRRTLGEEGVHVYRGDANSEEVLDAVTRAVPREALVIAYLDPQGLDLHLDTVRFLAWRYRRLDLLINLPLNGLLRYLSAPKNEPKAAAVLDHPDPRSFLSGGPRNGARDIRRHYAGQLRALGYLHQTSLAIRTADKKAALYDLIVAGRHPLTVELFQRANAIGVHGQRELGLNASGDFPKTRARGGPVTLAS